MKIVFNIFLCVIITFSGSTQSNYDTIIDFTLYSEDYVEYKPLLNNLKNGEQFIINFESIGCFHNTNHTLKIEKKSDIIYAEYNGTTKQLNKKEIKSLGKFENELKKPKRTGCTTTSTYTIISMNDTQRIMDGSCSWNGFYNLMEDLSIKIE